MRAVPFILFVIILTIVGCKDKRYLHYYGNKPIYLSYDELRSSVQLENAHSITEKGTFFLHQTTLYVVEPKQGIHIIDNSNPANPIQTGFLRVYGATNLSMKDDIMYVNSYIDLVVLDCSNPAQPVEVNRVKNLFPYTYNYPNNSYRTAQIDENLGVVIGFELADIKEEKTSINTNSNWLTSSYAEGVGPSIGGGSNTSGSINTFTTNSHHLYILTSNQIASFDISTAQMPIEQTKVGLSRWGETLLATETHLFIGTTSGMQIYSAPTSGTPSSVSEVTHIVACDPVAVDGNFAYYTIRSGTTCGMSANALGVVDISSISNPVLLNEFNLDNPFGLSAQNNKVWVCDNTSGVKYFDASNPSTVGNNLLSTVTGITAYDIIVSGTTAIVMGENGITQIDYTPPQNPSILSTIQF